ncbi:hypothetical protein RJ640_030267 [Escallonia rubra]|uniref:Cytochrome P450 n=1 Tax=Escallonia rubra TaxID=112253 RepID=A0AA88QPI6_9ASTE|nr:hypothetical protein RJ640_030267 [Escallonia rubra]
MLFLLQPTVFSLLLILAISLAFLFIKRSSPTRTTHKNLPPSPRKLPIIGNLHQLGSSPHRSLRSLSRRHGPLMLLHLGSVPVLVVSSADGAREITKNHDLVFSNRPKVSIPDRLLYGGRDVAFSPYGDYWRQDMFAAGTDTTQAVLEWGVAELLRHPNVMKKLQDEVGEIGRGKPKISEDDLEKMHYLKAVIKETLRLHTPVPLLVPRESTQDVKIMGYDIAAGTQVYINVWAIGRDPSLWEDAEEFRPERFLNSAIDYKGFHYQLIPFGAGRRGCPGMLFAMTLNELAVVNMVHKFDFALPDGAEDLDMTETAGITVHKKSPLLVTLLLISIYKRTEVENGSTLRERKMLEQQEPSFLLKSFLFFILPLCVIFFLIKWLFINPASNKRLPPSPPKLPIIGNFHQMGLFPHHSLGSLAKKYGPVMLLHLGSVPTIIISSADAAREIMQTHDLIFSNRKKSYIVERLLYDYKDVAASNYGEFWRQLRSVCVLQLLSNKRVQSFRTVREEETALMMKKIKESSLSSLPLDLSEMFKSLTNDVVCRAAFGRKYGGDDSGKKFKQLLTDFLWLLGSIDIGDFIPWLSWISRFNGFSAKVDRVAKDLDEFLERVVEERLDMLKMESGRGENTEGDSREDFVDTLLRIHIDNSAGVSVDRDSIKALILDIFAAGTDTTSAVLEWAMTELIRHPRVMKKVQNEVREILKDKPETTEADLGEMHYLNAVIKETLRLHPPIPMLVPREARQDARVMGYDIAAGTLVMTNAWAIGRDPASWDEPEEFRPERFLNSSIDFKGHDFELIPFGAGRRGCPGTAFAMATNELVLANLVHKFDWALPGKAKGEDLDIDECTGLTIHRKNPLLAIATPSVY